MYETTELICNVGLQQTYIEACDPSKVEASMTPLWENILNVHVTFPHIGKLFLNGQQPVDGTRLRVDFVLRSHNTGRPVIVGITECKRKNQSKNQLAALEEQTHDHGLFLSDTKAGLESSNPFSGLCCFGTRARYFRYLKIPSSEAARVEAGWDRSDVPGDPDGYKDPGKQADVQAFKDLFQTIFKIAGLVSVLPINKAPGQPNTLALAGSSKMPLHGGPGVSLLLHLQRRLNQRPLQVQHQARPLSKRP